MCHVMNMAHFLNCNVLIVIISSKKKKKKITVVCPNPHRLENTISDDKDVYIGNVSI